MTVEEFDIDDAPSGRRERSWSGETSPRARSRERAWMWVALGALLCAAGVIAAPAQSPVNGINLVPTLATPPELAWETALPEQLGASHVQAEVIGDAVIVTTDAAMAGYDLGSGDVLWRFALDVPPHCTFQVLVVCVTGEDVGTKVVTIEPRTGVVRADPLPRAAWATRVGEDVVALLYAERTQSVVRVADDGELIWSTEVPYQPGIGGTARGYPFARIDDRLYVGTAGPAILDLDTGATIARPLLLRYDRSGIFGLGFDETWWHLWTGRQVMLPEGSARLAVDDDLGGGTDVLISFATGITQLRDGMSEPYWSGVVGEEPIARLDGVLVTLDDREAVTHGVDIETGAQLWSAEMMSCPCLGADGVLLASRTQTVPAGLTAIDVHTGLPVWQLAFPPTASLVQLVDGGVLVAAPDRIVLYRW